MVSHTSRQEDFCCGTAGSNANGITARVARLNLFCAAGWQSSTPLYWPFALWAQAVRFTHKPIRGGRQVAIVAIFGGPVSQGFHLLAQTVHLLSMMLDHGVLLTEQCLLLPNQFVSLRQVFSQDLLLFSHSQQFFFDRHALTLLALTPFGKSPADLGCYSKKAPGRCYVR
jgi:hypothetical protein